MGKRASRVCAAKSATLQQTSCASICEIHISTTKLRRRHKSLTHFLSHAFTQYSRVSSVSVRNEHCARSILLRGEKGNGRENKPARDASHTYEITRYFCHPSPRFGPLFTPASRVGRNAKGERAHVHACTCASVATYACVSFTGVEEPPRRGQRVESTVAEERSRWED